MWKHGLWEDMELSGWSARFAYLSVDSCGKFRISVLTADFQTLGAPRFSKLHRCSLLFATVRYSGSFWILDFHLFSPENINIDRMRRSFCSSRRCGSMASTPNGFATSWPCRCRMPTAPCPGSPRRSGPSVAHRATGWHGSCGASCCACVISPVRWDAGASDSSRLTDFRVISVAELGQLGSIFQFLIFGFQKSWTEALRNPCVIWISWSHDHELPRIGLTCIHI